MKLLVDMNLSPSWADRLARQGFDAVHWSALGPPTAPDEQILAWGHDHGFVVITNDLDFSAILAATSGQTPSVMQICRVAPNASRFATVTASTRCAVPSRAVWPRSAPSEWSPVVTSETTTAAA